MARLYLDTEFNGFRGSLISMALVHATDPVWFYEALPLELSSIDPWVKQNVIPVLCKCPIPLAEFRRGLRTFLMQFNTPEIVCDWHADALHFADMLSGDSYVTSLDYPCRITILQTPPGQPRPQVPHNALSDASALRDWHVLVEAGLNPEVAA